MMQEKSKMSFEDRLDKLKREANQALTMDDTTAAPKIQRVQPYLRDRKTFKKFYLPNLLSIGPIHHGQENLKLGEQYKRIWTQKYLEEISKKQKTDVSREFYLKIATNIKELKNRYAEDVIQGHDDEDDLAWMLFVDGCSVLYFMDKLSEPEPKNLNIKTDQLVLMYQDMLLLENQLPFLVLQLLSFDIPTLKASIKNFLKIHNMVSRPEFAAATVGYYCPSSQRTPPPQSLAQSQEESIIQVQQHRNPHHLLDLLRTTILSCNSKVQHGKVSSAADGAGKNKGSPTYRVRSIQELKSVAIRVKKIEGASLNDISFTSNMLYGQLKLPTIIVDDFTAPTFANLIAYEMCPDFQNDFGISSYVAFLDMLIDHQEDVKALRKAGVLINSLGSDEEVAELFNVISTGLVPDPSKYAEVRGKVERYYKDRWKTWLAEAYHSYFRSPWSFVALLVGGALVALTLVQTWFTVQPNVQCCPQTPH